MHDGEDHPEPIEVPYRELSALALRGLIEAYVLREGTEYGERDHSLDEKVAAVMVQLERAEARILFDPETHAVELILVQRLSAKAARGEAS
jgi:uncharacterized protein